MRVLGLAAASLLLFAGCRKAPRAALTVPRLTGKRVVFAGPRQAAKALMPDFEFPMPRSVFGDASGLKPGVRLEAQTKEGKTLYGTVKSVDADTVVLSVDNWAWAPR